MKKLGLILGGLVLILLTAIVVIPFVVDVDQYRPKIVELSKDYIDGDLELGKLKLSLWGKIEIQIGGLKLKPKKGKEIISVQDASFLLPYTSIFSGSPRLTLELKKPDLYLEKDKSGQWNVVKIVKSKEEKQASPKETSESANSKTSESVAIPGIVAKSKLSISIVDAKLVLQDLQAASTTKLDQFSLKLNDISLEEKMSFSLSTLISMQDQKSKLSLEGPISLKGDVLPKIQDEKVDAKGSLVFSATDLEIKMDKTFHKKQGVPATFQAEYVYSQMEDRFDVKKGEIKFGEASIQTSLGLKKLSADATKNESPILSGSIDTNEVDLKGFAEMLPSQDPSYFSGKVKTNLKLSGTLAQMRYEGDFSLKNFQFKNESLKKPLEINLLTKIRPEVLESLDLSVTSGEDFDVKLTGGVKSFSNPVVDLVLRSKVMNLDAILNQPKEENKKEQKAASNSPGSAGGGSTQGDLDASLDPLRKNDFLKKLKIRLDGMLKKVITKGDSIEDIQFLFILDGLKLDLQKFSTKAFEGSLLANMKANLEPKMPSYDFQMQISGLDLKSAVENQLPTFRNTVFGRLDFSMKGAGRSFDPEKAKANLSTNGKIKVSNAVFTSIDIGKMVAEGLESSLGKIAEKVPALSKDKLTPKLSKGATEYEFIGGDFNLQNSVFQSKNFRGKSKAGKGLDFEGNTELNLISRKLNSEWMMIDTYALTRAEEVKVKLAGKEVDKILLEPGKPFQFPVKIECTMDNPCYKYNKMTEYLVKIATKNATGAAKSQVKEKVQEKIKEKVGEPLKDVFKGLKKKFF